MARGVYVERKIRQPRNVLIISINREGKRLNRRLVVSIDHRSTSVVLADYGMFVFSSVTSLYIVCVTC